MRSAGKIYWAQKSNDTIRRADFNGDNTETLLEWPEVNSPMAVAVDPMGGKVHWAQTFSDRIM